MKVLKAWTIVLLLLLSTGLFAQSTDSITFYLLRGIGRESGHWGQVVPEAIRQQIPQARFVKMDLPGAGKYHKKGALSTVEKMADFLRTEYAPHHDTAFHRRVIVATSLAGNVALEWITTYPTDFHGAVLISSSFKGVCKSKDRVAPQAKKDFIDIFLTNDKAKREEAFLTINSNLQTENDSLLRAWVDLQKQHPVSKKALLKQTVAGMIYQPDLTKPTAQLLIVGSEADKIVSTSCLQDVAKHLESDLYLHPTAGHGLPIDAPHWLADTLSHWVVERVLPFSFDSAQTGQFETRDSNNGLIRLSMMDKGLEATEDAYIRAWEATKGSWHWLSDGVDWSNPLRGQPADRHDSFKKKLREKKKDLRSQAASG